MEQAFHYDTVLVFARSWGGFYLAAIFWAAVIWTYWPSRKKQMDDAASVPLREQDKPCR